MGGLSNLGLTGYGVLLVLFLVRDVGVSAVAIGGLLMLTSTGPLADDGWRVRPRGLPRGVAQPGPGPA